MVVSTDPSAINKIRSVLEAQFDLEILLKRRELAAIKMELERGEECIEELRFLVSQDFQPRIRRVHAPDITAEFIPEPSPPPKPKKQTKRIPRKPAKESNTTPLYSRNEDGTYVKMFCPDCNRCNFATLQGFVNHCRIAHRLEFPNIEQCHRECGTNVDESEVPADHPCRRRHAGGSGIRRANRVQKAQPSTARKSKPTAAVTTATTTPSVAVTTPEKTKKPTTAKKSVNKPRKAPVEHKIEVQEEEIDLDLDEDMIQEANMNFEREVSAAATKSVSTGFPAAPRSGKKYPTSMSRIFTDSSSNSEKNDSSSSDSDVSSSDSSSPSTSPVRKTVVQSYPRKRPAPRFISEDEDSDSDCYEYHKRRAAEVYQKFVDRSDRGRLYQTEQQYCQTQEIR